MFPVQPSASRVAAYLDSRAKFTVVDSLLFNHGAESEGLADGKTWQALVARGARPGHLLGYGPALRRLASAPHPPR